ncbi:recombinase family protein [Sphingomonas sp. BE138]|uniref:recombinase family protein n=1 Tax=Sphingomonas sp. BE138 TaxID=2817845 RepID=UPI003869CCC4
MNANAAAGVHTGLIHATLIRETYAGRRYYGCRDSRTRKLRPRERWVEVQMPAILMQQRFQAVQQRLRAQSSHCHATISNLAGAFVRYRPLRR